MKRNSMTRLSLTLAAVAATVSLAVGTPSVKGQKKETERTVFLTPGGMYTKADIKANGGKTVSEKYPDFMPSHDANPKRGEILCPISKTKANPKLTWIVGGKTYRFCCPPCITEFVAKAKKNPKAIKPPQAYVKK